jgi:hypothetical protein
MSPKSDKGETPEPEPQEGKESVPPEVETPEAEDEEKFDEARAKELIKKLRLAEKQGKVDAKRLAEFEKQEASRREAEMTELQKANERAEAAERKARAAELAVMRRDAAARAKLPEALADRIKGETPEEMDADAAALLAAMPVKTVPPKTNATDPGSPQTGETDAEKAKRLGTRR